MPEANASSKPVPGAYAMNIAAPVYVMGDESDEDEEPIPEELIPQPRQTYTPAVDIEQPGSDDEQEQEALVEDYGDVIEADVADV